tara:strand:+ start:1456 stop:2331 length:876 start_codon:yes stop_codon:yes gene_type:complete
MKKIAVFLIIAFTSIEFYSQIKEVGLFAGGSYYIGELNRSHFSQQELSIGFVYKKDFPNRRVSLRFNLLYNQLKAVDFKSGDAFQINRNLDFRNSIIELGPIFEIDFFDFIPGQNNVGVLGFGTPYFLLGLGYARSNPQARKYQGDFDNFSGDWVDLQPLGTEGQETSFNPQKKYSRNQIVIPFGIGVKLNFTHHVSLSIEYGIRKTFTDYIDDVSGLYPNLELLEQESGSLSAAFSQNVREVYDNDGELIPIMDYSGLQRGNSADKDWYMVSGLILTYQIFSDSSCPKWK